MLATRRSLHNGCAQVDDVSTRFSAINDRCCKFLRRCAWHSTISGGALSENRSYEETAVRSNRWCFRTTSATQDARDKSSVHACDAICAGTSAAQTAGNFTNVCAGQIRMAASNRPSISAIVVSVRPLVSSMSGVRLTRSKGFFVICDGRRKRSARPTRIGSERNMSEVKHV